MSIPIINAERVDRMQCSLNEYEPEFTQLYCLSTGNPVPDTGMDLSAFASFLSGAIQDEALLLKEEQRGFNITTRAVFAQLATRLKEFGVRYLAHGYYRAAFQAGEWVVKCVLHPSFKEANECEFGSLKRLPDEYKMPFPQMYEIADGIMLQRYYAIDPARFRQFRTEITQMEKEMGLYDVHEKNIGWDDRGNFIFIDFPTYDQCLSLYKERGKVIGI